MFEDARARRNATEGAMSADGPVEIDFDELAVWGGHARSVFEIDPRHDVGDGVGQIGALGRRGEAPSPGQLCSRSWA